MEGPVPILSEFIFVFSFFVFPLGRLSGYTASPVAGPSWISAIGRRFSWGSS
jgi:hypothetical protein